MLASVLVVSFSNVSSKEEYRKIIELHRQHQNFGQKSIKFQTHIERLVHRLKHKVQNYIKLVKHSNSQGFSFRICNFTEEQFSISLHKQNITKLIQEFEMEDLSDTLLSYNKTGLGAMKTSSERTNASTEPHASKPLPDSYSEKDKISDKIPNNNSSQPLRPITDKNSTQAKDIRGITFLLKAISHFRETTAAKDQINVTSYSRIEDTKRLFYCEFLKKLEVTQNDRFTNKHIVSEEANEIQNIISIAIVNILNKAIDSFSFSTHALNGNYRYKNNFFEDDTEDHHSTNEYDLKQQNAKNQNHEYKHSNGQDSEKQKLEDQDLNAQHDSNGEQKYNKEKHQDLANHDLNDNQDFKNNKHNDQDIKSHDPNDQDSIDENHKEEDLEDQDSRDQKLKDLNINTQGFEVDDSQDDDLKNQNSEDHDSEKHVSKKHESEKRDDAADHGSKDQYSEEHDSEMEDQTKFLKRKKRNEKTPPLRIQNKQAIEKALTNSKTLLANGSKYLDYEFMTVNRKMVMSPTFASFFRGIHELNVLQTYLQEVFEQVLHSSNLGYLFEADTNLLEIALHKMFYQDFEKYRRHSVNLSNNTSNDTSDNTWVELFQTGLDQIKSQNKTYLLQEILLYEMGMNEMVEQFNGMKFKSNFFSNQNFSAVDDFPKWFFPEANKTFQPDFNFHANPNIRNFAFSETTLSQTNASHSILNRTSTHFYQEKDAYESSHSNRSYSNKSSDLEHLLDFINSEKQELNDLKLAFYFDRLFDQFVVIEELLMVMSFFEYPSKMFSDKFESNSTNRIDNANNNRKMLDLKSVLKGVSQKFNSSCSKINDLHNNFENNNYQEHEMILLFPEKYYGDNYSSNDSTRYVPCYNNFFSKNETKNFNNSVHKYPNESKSISLQFRATTKNQNTSSKEYCRT